MIRRSIICLMCCMPAVLPAEETAPAVSNVTFLSSVINREVRGLVELGALKAIRKTGETAVRMQAVRPNPADWMLEEVITGALADGGVLVILPARKETPTAPLADTPVPADTSIPAPAAVMDSIAPAAGDSTAKSAAVQDPVPAPVTAAPAPAVTASAVPATPLVFEYRLVECAVMYEKIWREGLIGPKKISRSGYVAGVLRLVDTRTGALLWSRKFDHAQSDVVPFKYKNQIENSQYNYKKTDTPRPYWRSFTETVLAGGSVGYLLYLFFSKSFN